MADHAPTALADGHVRMVGPPRANALQVAWLREIGIPRPFVQLAEPALPPQTPVVNADAVAARQDQADIAAQSKAAQADSQQGVPAPTEPPVETSVRPGKNAPAVRSGPPPKPKSTDKPADVVITRVPGDIERADSAALRQQVATCESCDLHASRKQAVYGAGPDHASWMIVGEAPGEQEDEQGLPFVGKSGELLTQMLRSIGLSRDEVYLSNVIKCRPPGNRNPRADEIDVCKPFLMRQIQLVQPQRVLAVGRFAAQVLLGSDANLNALRGRVHTLEDGQGRSIPLIVSYHPAYLLRSPQEKARTWRDLKLALNQVSA